MLPPEHNKAETNRQLALSTADPILLEQVWPILSQFHRMLTASPVEMQKNLLQTIVKQIHVKTFYITCCRGEGSRFT